MPLRFTGLFILELIVSRFNLEDRLVRSNVTAYICLNFLTQGGFYLAGSHEFNKNEPQRIRKVLFLIHV